MTTSTLDSQLKYSESYLTLEVLLIGGLSILTSLGFWMFFDKSSSLVTISSLAFAAAFAVNHPHFLSSYVLMYGDFSNKIFKEKRYFWSAVIVPVILFFTIGYGLYKMDKIILGHMASGMYFLVGWHYVKQIFGFIVVTSAHRKQYYSDLERKILLTNLFSIWFLSFLGPQIGEKYYAFYGMPYQSYNLPSWSLQLDIIILVLSLFAVISMQVKKYIDHGFKPAPPAVAAFVAIYVWYIPAFSHPGFGYLIPFFHSLQYLSFVWILKRNQTDDLCKNLSGPEARKSWLKNFGGFIFLSLLIGALCFEFIPNNLDKLGLIPVELMGTTPFLAAFLLFINIHHYFIDNTIWRSTNETVKKYLF